MTTTTAITNTGPRLSPAALVGGAFALTTGLNLAIHVGELYLSDKDPNAPEGAISSLQSIAVVGGIGLVLALAIALPLAGEPQRAKVGAIVLGALAIITLPLFWSGAPASLGAAAAWLGGFARGSHPQGGVARGFGVVGIVIVVLLIVATVFGAAVSALLG